VINHQKYRKTYPAYDFAVSSAFGVFKWVLPSQTAAVETSKNRLSWNLISNLMPMCLLGADLLEWCEEGGGLV
jgi:hypothetical protein